MKKIFLLLTPKFSKNRARRTAEVPSSGWIWYMDAMLALDKMKKLIIQ
jgi:hypothetical protein